MKSLSRQLAEAVGTAPPTDPGEEEFCAECQSKHWQVMAKCPMCGYERAGKLDAKAPKPKPARSQQ